MTGAKAAEGRWPSPVTWDGFRDFVERPPVTPPEAGGVERGVEERLAYHSRFAVVRTPTIDAISRTVRTLMILGRHQDTGARPCVIVTGPPTTGKTTALLQVGRACHLAEAARRGGRGWRGGCRWRTSWSRPERARRHWPGSSPGSSGFR